MFKHKHTYMGPVKQKPLQKDLLQLTFTYLNESELFKCKQVCRYWLWVAAEDPRSTIKKTVGEHMDKIKFSPK